MDCYYTTELSISGTTEEMAKALLKLMSFTEGDVTLGTIYMHRGAVLASGEKGHSGSGKKGQLVVG